ncbi:MAG TPA: cupredoxin domain-containing protein [Dehalococcoidia bacterium]
MLSLSPVKWTRILLPVAAGLLLLAAACGGDDDDGGNGNGDTGTPAATETAPADGIEPQPAVPQELEDEVTEAAGGVIQTVAADVPTFSYSPNHLKVPLNETTTIEITNEGAALHNLRIAGPDGEWNTDDDTVSDPDLISGGGTGVVEFTPTLAGTYTFRCDIHPDVQGGVIVAG